MKRLLLCLAMAVFVLACSKSTEDPYADMNKSLASYTDACANVVFSDTRSTMSQVDQLYAEGKTQEAADLYVTAQSKYDEAVSNYADYKNRIDKANSTMQNQLSRLNAISSDAQKVAPTEYANTTAAVSNDHTLAADALAKCDVSQAEGYLADADTQITSLENLVKTRLGQPVVSTPSASAETYVVMKGDSLWKIAASKYSNPYFWPLIYWSNNASIKDPDLIYPNQQLTIEKNNTASKQTDAEKLARTRGAWSLFDGK